MSTNTVNLDRLFGSLNLASTIINGDFSGFELASYSDVPSEINGALNESLFSNRAKGMGFLIKEWPERTRVVLYNFSAPNPLAEVEYNNDNPMLEMLLKKLCNPSSLLPIPEFMPIAGRLKPIR